LPRVHFDRLACGFLLNNGLSNGFLGIGASRSKIANTIPIRSRTMSPAFIRTWKK
jgi:hypothetical protein